MFIIPTNRGPVRRARPVARPARAYGAAALAAVLVLAIAGDTRAGTQDQWEERVVVAAALKSTVPPELALAVARARVGERLRGKRFGGRIGVMEISPAVARGEFGVRAQGMWGPKANAGLGVALLERLYRRYGERWDLALSHYRGGPLTRCESGPVVHERTIGYVADVMEQWRRHQKDEKMAALIEEVRRHGVRALRFSDARGLSSGEDRGRGVRFNLWHDDGGVRI